MIPAIDFFKFHMGRLGPSITNPTDSLPDLNLRSEETTHIPGDNQPDPTPYPCQKGISLILMPLSNLSNK